MRKLYGSTNWRRLLALVLVFAMLFSAMGTSGYSVFADSQDETGGAVYSAEPEAVTPDVTEDIQGPSPGNDAEEIAEAPELIEEVEAEAAEEESEETVEAEAEEGEEPEESEAVEEGEEIAEPAEEAGEDKEIAEPVEEAGEDEEIAELVEVIAEAEEPAEVALVEEDSQKNLEDVEAEAEEPVAVSIVEEFKNGLAEELATPSEEIAEPADAAEETEPAEEPEITYPAWIDVKGFINGTTVTINADEGTFPKGTEMVLSEVNTADIWDTVADALDAPVVKMRAVDITFLYGGEEIQPLKPISVKMNASGYDEDMDRAVVHIDDKGEADVVEDADLSKKAIEFEAEHFSIYVVVESGVEARLLVKFVQLKGDPVEIYVKAKDLENQNLYESILYDPGLDDDLENGVIFKGWIADKPDYTVNDTALTIDAVRDEVAVVLRKTGDEAIKDGDERIYYPVLVKQYSVTYLGLSNESLGTGYAEYRADAVPDENGKISASYKVNMSYTPEDEEHNFEGWIAYRDSGKNIVDHNPNINLDPNSTEEKPSYLGTIYQNGTTIMVTGNVTFGVNAPEGHWLVFDENGKGGKYNAPQFILKDKVTEKPCEDSAMKRYGYEFSGWYTDQACTDGNEFTFGGTITKTTTIYAKWTPHETAPYTVIFWTQNLNRNGYEVAGSRVIDDAPVGRIIPYTSVDNGDEDYVTGFGDDVGHYTGFCLTEGSKNQEVTVTPEGDAVLNLKYDRIDYKFKFYLYRDGTQNNAYDYANNSNNGSSLGDLVTWHTNQNAHPSVNGYTIQSETVGGRTYYYFEMDAFYGEDISSKWPTYDKITGANGRQAVSYVMMVGTKLKPNPTNQGSGTVKGLITVMNENILGATNDAKGNYVVVRFPDNFYNWRYHIWFETADGEDYTGKTTRPYNGKTYYEETVLVVRSSNTGVDNQNEPKYTGFDFIEKRGQNWNNSNYWTTTEDGTTLYNLNFVYNRQTYKISYFDGNYIDGRDNQLDNRAAHLLHESPAIGQGVTIAETYSNYEPEETDEFVFEGWFVDEGCTTPYLWVDVDEETGTETPIKMPVGGIRVYAKWRQVEYRVFLHPNAGTDPSLDWGSDTQQMNFRVAYGGKISAPTGTRNNWKFVGWYLDEARTEVFNENLYILNETTVTTEYDKTTHMTDPMDKWGNGAKTNNDINRDWITKEFNLYAEWRAVVEGAIGIQVEYSLEDTSYDPAITGDGNPKDDNLYVDNATATAVPAVKAPDGYQFSKWVLQRWDGAEYVDIPETDDNYKEIFAGGKYTVHLSDAYQEIISTHEEDVYELNEQGYPVLYDEIPDDGGTYHKFVDGEKIYYKKWLGKEDVIDEANYTIRLRAHYIPVEEATPTYIPWYRNDGTKAFRTDVIDDDGSLTLGINEAVEIENRESIINRDGYVFKGWALKDMGNTPEAAATFANTESNYTQKLSDMTMLLYYKDGAFYSDEACTKEAELVAADEVTPYQALFAVWEEKEKATVTVHHYLKGTTTQVADDVTAQVTVDTDYEASSVETYQSKTLTVDSYDPSQKITVSASDNNVITIYYTLPLTIEASTPDSKTYDGQPLSGSYTISGELSSDTSTITAAIGSAPSITNAGTQTYQASTTGIPGYYVVTNTPGTLKIDKAPVTITAARASKKLGANDPEFAKAEMTGDYIGAELEAIDLTVIRTNASVQAVGTYTDVLTIASTKDELDATYPNYVFTIVPADFEIIGSRHLTVEKTIPDEEEEKLYKLGETIEYEITVTNDGDLTIENFNVVDSLTGEKWLVTSLDPGRSVTFNTEHEVTEEDILNGHVYNKATIESRDSDNPPPHTPGEKDVPTDDPNPSVVVTKRVTSTAAREDGAYVLGETIKYEIAVTNNGNLTLKNIVVTDELTGNVGDKAWTIASLAPGASYPISVEYVVQEKDILARTVVNSATAAFQPPTTPDDPPETPPDDPPTTPDNPPIEVPTIEPPEVPVEPVNPKLSITKEVTSKSTLDEGYALNETVKYKITVKNEGNLTLTNVTVTDTKLKKQTWAIGTLEPGATYTLPEAETTYIVTKEDVASVNKEIVNIATVTGVGPEGNNPNQETAEAIAKTTEKTPTKVLNVVFYTNYPDELLEKGWENEYSETYYNVPIPYEVPGFVTVFDASMIPDGYKTESWEVHKPAKTSGGTNNVVNADEDTVNENGMASTSSSSNGTKITEEPSDVDIIFYALWEEDNRFVPSGGTIPPKKPDPDPDNPDPDDEPDPDIPDPDVPLSPYEEEDEIPDEDTPFSDYEEEPDEELDEEPTPLSPYTGDDRHTAVWGFVSLMSLAGIAVLGRKRREEEE